MIIGVLILASILNAWQKYQNKSSTDKKIKYSRSAYIPNHATAGMVDSMNTLFLETIGIEPGIKFLRFYSYEQRIVLRSILQYENINSYLEATHAGSVYPKLTSGIHDSILYINQKDLTKAKEIYNDYIKTVTKNRIIKKRYFFLKAIFFFFFGVIVAETTVQYRPDLLA
jgi:hypothetical protein